MKTPGLILLFMMAGLVVVNAPATAASVGEIAPDFEVTTHDGDVVRLSEF